MYDDRVQAGRRLAQALVRQHVADADAATVLGLPRGGVPVGAEVARLLGMPLDVLIVRKVGAPFDPEFAIGAVGEDDVVVIDDATVDRLGIAPTTIARLVDEQRHEVARRRASVRARFPRLPLVGRTAIVVDDGLATGATAAAAVAVARAHGAERVVVAAPVGSSSAIERLAAAADAVVCPERPSPFDAVGNAYRDFRQVTDAEAVDALAAARGPDVPDAPDNP